MSLDTPRIPPTYAQVANAHGGVRVAEVKLGGVPRGAAIVLCETGRLDFDAAVIMNSFAEHGYESVAADLSTLRRDEDLMDGVEALLEHVGRRGWSPQQVGVVGYGLGGRVALLAAGAQRLGAAVSVSPAGLVSMLSEGVPALLSPWLGMFGDRDAANPQAAVLRLRAALGAASPVYAETVIYRGVDQAFWLDSPRPAGHAAAFDCWQRTVEWFNVRVQPRPSPMMLRWRAGRRVAA